MPSLPGLEGSLNECPQRGSTELKPKAPPYLVVDTSCYPRALSPSLTLSVCLCLSFSLSTSGLVSLCHRLSLYLLSLFFPVSISILSHSVTASLSLSQSSSLCVDRGTTYVECKVLVAVFLSHLEKTGSLWGVQLAD